MPNDDLVSLPMAPPNPYLKAGLLAVGYMLLAAAATLLYTSDGSVAYFWPANALVAVVLLHSRRSEWPLLLAMVIPAELCTDLYFGLPWLAGAGLGAVNLLESGVAAWLMRRYIPRRPEHTVSLRSLWRFIAICAAAPALSACLGAVVLQHIGMAQTYGVAWRTWWIGDALGFLLCVPAFWVVAQRNFTTLRAAPPLRWLEALILISALIWVANAAFGSLGRELALRSAVFPLLVWAALRFGIAGATWALVAVALIAVRSDLFGHFIAPAGSDPRLHALAVQAFLTIASITTLTLASALAERRLMFQRFRRVADAAPSGIVMIDTHGRIRFANARMQRMFGYTAAELHGAPVDVLAPGTAQAANDWLRAPPPSEPRKLDDLLVQRKDGAPLTVEVGLNSVDTEDGPMLLAAVTDVTARKKTEQDLRQAYRDKEVLLKEVYHRVKNNLQIVSALIALQAKNLPERSAREALARGEARIHSMALVHEQLYRSDNLATLDGAGYVTTLARYLRSQFSDHVSVEVACDAVALGMDQAIPCGLIITELVTNASRHAFPDGRRGKIKIALNSNGGERVLLEVADNGVGLPDGVEHGQRSSLGWELVRSLAKQLGGEVSVVRDSGTTVRVSFVTEQKLEAA